MQTIDKFNFAGKKAFVRVDFNVPLDENFNITDDTRMRAALPTLKKILADGGSIIIGSHLGRPKGVADKFTKDICKYISDPLNPMYDAATAAQEAFSLLTIPTKCPPDLMEYVINNHYIPDAQFPEFGERELVQKNADFIARHSLLYYYRGD